MASDDSFVQEIREGAGATDSLGAYSSFQMACFFTFSVVLVLYAYAELLQHKANKNGGGSSKREDDADETLPVSSAGVAGAAPAGVSNASGPSGTMGLEGPTPDKINQLAPVRCLMGDKHALLNSRGTLRAWAEFGLILGLFYFADRSGSIPDSDKKYDRDLFFAIFLALAAYG